MKDVYHAKKHFCEHVFPRELDEIAARRSAAGLGPLPGFQASPLEAAEAPGRLQRFMSLWKPPKPDPPRPTHPSTDFRLVGLALSGGGIRSASFCLGVLQTLAEKGILRQVDYLSTVSGGGYIGSCLSAAASQPQTAGTSREKFPFRHEPGQTEPRAFKQLRNHASYLAQRGLLEWARIPALVLRGVVTNLLLALPVLALLAVAAKGIWGAKLTAAAWLPPATASTEELSWGMVLGAAPWSYLAPAGWAALGWAAYVVATQVTVRLPGRQDWLWRDLFQKSFGALLLLVVGVFLFTLQPVAIELYARFGLQAGAFGDQATWTAIGGALAPMLVGHKASDASSRWTGKLGLALLGLLGPLVLWLVFLRLSAWVIYGSVDATEIFGIHGEPVFVVIPSLVAIGFFMLVTDVNRSSLHNFYRDRLSRAFIWTIDPEKGKIRPADDLKLSALNSVKSDAPYHLVNAALNLQASRDADLRDRQSDFFLFSKRFVGCQRDQVGFCKTADMEAADPHLNLATAMAISGAAVAPNMGAMTIRPLTFVLSLLNLRLGYWLPHPKTLREEHSPSLLTRLRSFTRRAVGATRVGPGYLLLEMFGWLSESRSNLNVSDGGHLENLGLYELLKRRCSYIIVCDAEADADLSFGSLARVMRYARTDLATEINLDLDPLRLTADKTSRRKCAIGEITYPDGEHGQIVYVKSSYRGDEVEYIREYRKEHPDFPHESTADQFFDEAQFEAYRALGYHSHRDLFPPRRASEASFENGDGVIAVDRWFDFLNQTLHTSPASDDHRIALDRDLVAIEKALGDSKLWRYREEIYPQLPGQADSPPPSQHGQRDDLLREAFHVGQMQMHLLEDAHRVLELENPAAWQGAIGRGYMNLFRRWSHSPTFRRIWAISVSNYGAGFQAFCEYALGLKSSLTWKYDEQQKGLSHLERQELARMLAASDETSSEPVSFEGRLIARNQIWVAHLETSLAPLDATETFPVGLASLTFRDGGATERRESGGLTAVLRYYRVRDEFRRMGLLPQMLRTLPGAIAAKFPGTRVVIEPPKGLKETVSRHAPLFQRAGIGTERLGKG